MHKNLTFILSLIIFCLASNAHAGEFSKYANQELAKSLWDKNLIEDSVISISNMSVDAVENLSNVLGSCLPIKGGQFREYFCEREKIKFQIKFNVPHSINSIVNALIASANVMIDQSKITSEEHRKYIMELVQQQNFVINTIGDAISQRLANKD